MAWRKSGANVTLCPRDLWRLAGLALLLRLGYLWLGVQSQSLGSMCLWANDTKNYLSVAHYWLTGDPAGEQAMLLAGPGYGLILAGLQAVFGVSQWPPLILNLMFGCAAPVVVYLTAFYLVGNRPVAVLAGLIACVSVTSLSVSTSVLSDQPFYTLHALALLLFLRGWQIDRSRWFIAAGITAGIATWIRVMGQIWPLVFVLMALLLLYLEPGARTWARFRHALWTPAILLAFIVSWSAFNYSRYGVFTLTTNGARSAWLYLGARALGMHTPGLDTETARARITEELKNETAPENSEVDMYHLSLTRFRELTQSHPWWVLSAFAHNVKENVQESNYDLYRQLPQLKSVLDVFTRQARDWLNDWIFWGSAAGLVLLVMHRRIQAWILLGLTFLVFTLVTGFSFWQGSRLHYPAEMAWSILLSYFLVFAGGWVYSLLRRNRATAPA